MSKKAKVRILQTRHPLYKAGDVVELDVVKAHFAAANRWAEIIETPPPSGSTRKTATSKKAESRTTATTVSKSSKKSTTTRRKRKKK